MQHLIKDLAAYGNATATAGTAITKLFKPKGPLKTWIAKLRYKVATTAHTLTVMRPQSQYVKLTADAASGQAVVNIASDPGVGATSGAIAANDWVVLLQDDGSYLLTTVSSVSTLAITLATNLTAKASASSAKFWLLGLPADGHPQYVTGTADTEAWGSDASVSGVGGAERSGEPVVVHSDNSTAAGTFLEMQGVYLDAGR